MRKQEFRDYLIKNSTVNKETGCWEWDKCLDSQNGYGITFRNKIVKHRRAHRLSYIIFIGPVSKGLFVCHDCDNPKCINPKHLFLGTHQDNMNDMVMKGRQRGGRFPGKSNPFYGKKHTQEAKDKIGKAVSICQKGKGNSRYGTCWIYNLKLGENKSIPRFELKEWLDKGWTKGRKMKF